MKQEKRLINYLGLHSLLHFIGNFGLPFCSCSLENQLYYGNSTSSRAPLIERARKMVSEARSPFISILRIAKRFSLKFSMSDWLRSAIFIFGSPYFFANRIYKTYFLSLAISDYLCSTLFVLL